MSAPQAIAARFRPGRPKRTDTNGVPSGIAAALPTAPPKPAAPVALRPQAAMCTVKSVIAEYATAVPYDAAASNTRRGPSVKAGSGGPERLQVLLDFPHVMVLQSAETVPMSTPMLVKFRVNVVLTRVPVALPYAAVVVTKEPVCRTAVSSQHHYRG